MWRAAGLAAALLCVAAPLLLPWQQMCPRGSPLVATARDAAWQAAWRQLNRPSDLEDTQPVASAAALATQVRQISCDESLYVLRACWIHMQSATDDQFVF